MHQRRQIIKAIQANLVAVKYFSWVRNTRAPILPTVANAYPGVTLYIDNEPVITETIHLQPRPQSRTPLVVIRVWLKGTNDPEYVEEQMDIQSARVEEVMSNAIPGIDDLRLVSTDFEVVDEEPLLHVVTLSYQLDYFSYEMRQEPI